MKLLLEIAVIGGASGRVRRGGHHPWNALAFAAVAAVSVTLTRIWRQ